jgi:uncharacterized membrane protein YheB (UPF0754 family)
MAGAEYAWYLLALIPIISATIGYGTNVVAVKMMFWPVEFVGLRRPLGWQGVVPANAVKLSKALYELITARLLKLRELFSAEEADALLEASDDRFREMTRRVVHEQAQSHFKPMWDTLPEAQRESLYALAYSEVQKMARRVLGELLAEIEKLIDLRPLVIQTARENPALMGRIFRDVGREEFRFIQRSGAYFGFLFGLVQLGVWLVFPEWWILPLFGLLVGYATNWVAIRLVFEPREPRRVLGLTVQGLFHRRKEEVAGDFSAAVAAHVLTDEALFSQLTSDASRRHILDVLRREAEMVMAQYQSHPLAAGLVDAERAAQMEAAVLAEVESEMFRAGGVLAQIAAKSDRIRATLHDKMRKLPPEPFEGVLRPAFQQDEWKLIAAGAALGLVAGVLQLVYLFGEALAQGI